MPFPTLTTFLEPFGNFSPMGVLWSSIGAAPAYEIFAGLAELLGAVLLMFPRTVTLGALVCTVDMFQVFMLNMTYDVPVKQFSLHLLLLSMFLLAPQMSRLADFFVRNRPVMPKQDEALFQIAAGQSDCHRGAVGFVDLDSWNEHVPDAECLVRIRPGSPEASALWDLGCNADDERWPGAPGPAHRRRPLAAHDF